MWIALSSQVVGEDEVSRGADPRGRVREKTLISSEEQSRSVSHVFVGFFVFIYLLFKGGGKCSRSWCGMERTIFGLRKSGKR
ncbi:hypothetical protein BJX64DRAFT_247461 [Aspergillus heterothallicus]